MIKRKPLELPPEVARRFFEDMRAFHREPNPIKRDEIAARQLHALAENLGAGVGVWVFIWSLTS